MPRWLKDVLARIREMRATARFASRIRRSANWPRSISDWTRTIAAKSLEGLTIDSAGRNRSVITGEWMYMFKPTVGGTLLYLKVIVRGSCIVISFHEEGQ